MLLNHTQKIMKKDTVRSANWHRQYRIRHRFISCALLSLVLVLFFFGQLPSYSRYTTNRVGCYFSKDERKHLMDLAFQIHTILDSMELPHWLMYGSIYGAMRYDAPLPWDNDVDMGMRREDFDSIDFMEFSAKFKAAGIEFRNGLAQAGKFHFTKIGGKLEVDLFLFRDYGGVLWRTGIEPWLLYVHYRRHHTFPTWLVKLPLPKTKFGSFEIGLPRGEFEILKHLYPDDWWKVVKPQACHDT